MPIKIIKRAVKFRATCKAQYDHLVKALIKEGCRRVNGPVAHLYVRTDGAVTWSDLEDHEYFDAHPNLELPTDEFIRMVGEDEHGD